MFFAFEWTVIAVMIVLNGILSAYEMALAGRPFPMRVPSHAVAAGKARRRRGSLYEGPPGGQFCRAAAGHHALRGHRRGHGRRFCGRTFGSSLLILRWGLSALSAKLIAMTLFVLPLSVATILFAELLPKLFALRNREWVCLWLSPTMKRLATLMSPIVGGLEWIVKRMLALGQKYFRGLSLQTEAASLNELRAAVALARTSRVIGAREEKIVLAAAQLATRPIQQVVLAAADISMISIHATLTEALLQAHLDLHTRFPICTAANDPQSINGYITFKDLVVALKMKPSTPTVEGIIRPIKKIQEDSFISQVLEQMMREKIHIALVVAKTGTVLGMITLEDIVEEMLGDIEDEFDHLPTHFHPAGPGWIMGGGVSMTTVYQCLGLSLETAPPAIRSLRLAEWCALVLGRAVARGDILRAEGIEVSVRKLRRRKVSEAFLSLVSK